MILTAQPEAVQRISLLDALDGEWIKLPTQAMLECGAAAQTLGGLLRITNRETYASTQKIAAEAGEALSTTRRHLLQLEEAGFIKNVGRKGRRTPTIRVLQKALDAGQDYGVLPWWAPVRIRTLSRGRSGARGGGRMPWGARAVLSVVLTRLATLRKIIDEKDGQCDLDAEDVWGSLEHLGGDAKFRFSIAYLRGQTGLWEQSIIEAKHWLVRHGLIRRYRTTHSNGGFGRDCLVPSETFRVLIVDAGGDRCWIDFEARSGHRATECNGDETAA